MGDGRWRKVASQIGRSVTVWAVSTLTMLALAGILPDFRLRSADGSSATDIAVTAALGAGAFGLLSALVWPLLVRLLLLVAGARPRRAGVLPQRRPAVGGAARQPRRARFGGPRDGGGGRRRDVRRRVRDRRRARRPRRRRLPAAAVPARGPKTALRPALPGHPRHGLRPARRRRPRRPAGRRRQGPDAHRRPLARHRRRPPHPPPHPPGAPTGPARPAPASSASCTAATSTSPPSAGTRRPAAR